MFNIVKNIVGEGMLSLPAGIAGGTGALPTMAFVHRRKLCALSLCPQVCWLEPWAPSDVLADCNCSEF